WAGMLMPSRGGECPLHESWSCTAPRCFELITVTFEQDFRPYLSELARFETTRELERSSLFRKLKPSIECVLSHVWLEELIQGTPTASDSIRAVAWNIERGMRLDAVVRALREHSSLAGADILLLSELDWGMARTENRFVAREIASSLGMNYAFAPCYVAL